MSKSSLPGCSSGCGGSFGFYSGLSSNFCWLLEISSGVSGTVSKLGLHGYEPLRPRPPNLKL